LSNASPLPDIFDIRFDMRTQILDKTVELFIRLECCLFAMEILSAADLPLQVMILD
jgi:hypothetical protein